MVRPLDEDGRPAALWLEKRGEAVPPERVIPADVKWELADRLPEPLSVVRGSLDRLVEVLRRREP